MKHEVSAQAAPSPGGAYSQGIVVNGLLYTAGFGPVDPSTGAKPEGIAAQTRQVLRNLAAVLEEAGLDFSDVVKATVHLQNLEQDFVDFDDAYREFFSQPYPVRTTVGSQLLDILVEIDVVAAIRV